MVTWTAFVEKVRKENKGMSLGDAMKKASPQWKKMKKGKKGGDGEEPVEEPAEEPAEETADPVSVTEVPGEDVAATSGGARRKSRRGRSKKCRSKRRSCRRSRRRK